MTQEISSAEWQAKVLDSDKPVLVDFFATWCGPCKIMAPVIDEIGAENADKFNVYKINIDENPDVAQKYAVAAIPTFIAFKNGQPAAKAQGAKPKETILGLMA